jgi:hypothetical protein
MKNIILSTVACLLALNSFGQLTEIVSEVYADHSDTGIEALEGMTTYRVYAVFTNELDEVSAVYGDVSSPLSLTSSEGFFQSEFGSAQGWNINTAFFCFRSGSRIRLMDNNRSFQFPRGDRSTKFYWH